MYRGSWLYNEYLYYPYNATEPIQCVYATGTQQHHAILDDWLKLRYVWIIVFMFC